MSEDIKRQKTEFCGYKITVTECEGQQSITFLKMPNDRNDERSVANVDAQSGAAGQTKSWQTEFTYFLEHLITHDKEKINLIVDYVERIAGSKKEVTKANKLLEALEDIANNYPEWDPIEVKYDCQVNAAAAISEYQKTQP